MNQLGTLEELPADYRKKLTDLNLVPLWPSLRAVLPYGIPSRKTQPILWKYADVQPLLMQAGELTPIEKAERRVLVLANPGHGLENMQATANIYLGLQLIQPGETAPNHQHTPSAVRFVIEGNGGYTVVDGEKLPMEKGDLILTPPGLWHEHGHEGTEPVIWLDALDLPIVYAMEASYCTEGPSQQVSPLPDSSQTRFRRSGLLAYDTFNKQQTDYPLLRFPWQEVKSALNEYASIREIGEAVQLAYINPETGKECLPTLGFSALMLRPGEELKPVRRSASTVYHVIEGQGTANIDGVELTFQDSDTFTVPTHAEVRIQNTSSENPAYIFLIDDAPVQRKLGFYEEFNT